MLCVSVARVDLQFQRGHAQGLGHADQGPHSDLCAREIHSSKYGVQETKGETTSGGTQAMPNPSSAPISYVTLDKLFNFSEPLLPSLQAGSCCG